MRIRFVKMVQDHTENKGYTVSHLYRTRRTVSDNRRLRGRKRSSAAPCTVVTPAAPSSRTSPGSARSSWACPGTVCRCCAYASSPPAGDARGHAPRSAALSWPQIAQGVPCSAAPNRRIPNASGAALTKDEKASRWYEQRRGERALGARRQELERRV